MTPHTETHTRTEPVQQVTMEELHIAHLAGVFDAIGTITGHITKRDNTLGYRFDPLVQFSRPADEEMLLGKMDAYCEDAGVRYINSTAKRGETETFIMEIKNPDSIERFLTPMMPYFTTKYEYAMLMLEEVLPMVRNDEHLDKPGFYELVGYSETLRETSRHGPDAKYTQEYFKKEWDDLPTEA